jgi:hypothetical protein
MQESSLQIRTLVDLRSYVQQQLCDQNELEVGAFQLTEQVLEKQGNPCGIYFCLHGPRSVKLIAIWETRSNSILFYGSTGQRVHRIRLANAPSWN